MRNLMRYVLLVIVVLCIAIYGLASRGPWSQRVSFERDVDHEIARSWFPAVLMEDDLSSLPPLVQRYVRKSGAVGNPQVHNMRVRFHGAIRKTADARWMPMTVLQYNHFDKPSRLFFLTAAMFGVPFEAYHRYVDTTASMRVKALSLFSVVNAHGAQMTTAETVTLLNDMCILAPGTLVDPHISWQTIDSASVRATFTNAGNRINATLVFNADGDLVNFWSDDRWALSADGKAFERLRWSTPMRDYQQFGMHRLPRLGEARYQRIGNSADTGFAYATFDLQSVTYNVTAR